MLSSSRLLVFVLVMSCNASPGAPAGHVHPASASEESFEASMRTAMARMDQGMSVVCTHDPDHDFAAMMVPHHQGAVDMALVELRYGKDQRLRRLAEGIIVEQRSEIALMRSILAESGAP
jgi:uncharacterized protein (DUF305 family)